MARCQTVCRHLRSYRTTNADATVTITCPDIFVNDECVVLPFTTQDTIAINQPAVWADAIVDRHLHITYVCTGIYYGLVEMLPLTIESVLATPLRSLALDTNAFTGSIPDGLYNLTRLVYVNGPLWTWTFLVGDVVVCCHACLVSV